MDNATRSERSRNAVLEAALAIIARGSPGRLTLDAITRESDISKGGLIHQFRTKEAVLEALLQRQTEHFEDFAQQPRLLSTTRRRDARNIEVIKAEGSDGDLAILRWAAAWGLMRRPIAYCARSSPSNIRAR
jgi:AcrR family transcriptional regulator